MYIYIYIKFLSRDKSQPEAISLTGPIAQSKCICARFVFRSSRKGCFKYLVEYGGPGLVATWPHTSWACVCVYIYI